MLFTKRLHLRKFKETDYKKLLLISKEKEIQKYVPYLYNGSEKNFKDNFETYLKGDLKNDFYIAVETHNNVLIGGFIIVRLTSCILDVSYFISNEYTKNGYCIEALKEILNYFNSNYPNYILSFTIKSDNFPSLEIMNSLNIDCAVFHEKFRIYTTSR